MMPKTKGTKMLDILDATNTDEITVETLNDMIVRASMMIEAFDMDDRVVRGLLDARNALAESSDDDEEDNFDHQGEKLYVKVWAEYVCKNMGISNDRAMDNYSNVDLPFGSYPKKLLIRVARAVACRDCREWKAVAAYAEKHFPVNA